MAGLFIAGAKIQAGKGGIIARGRRTTSSTGTTSEIGVLRLDDLPIIAGRAYRIWTTPLNMDSTVANDISGTQIRHTTDGSTPTTSSTILPGSNAQYRQADAANGEHLPSIQTTYTPGSNQTLSLLLTARRVGGTGTVVMFGDATNIIEMVVEDIGVDPGDTGVDI